MKILRRQGLEEMKDCTKNTMIEENERLNKVKIAKKQKVRKDANDVAQQEFCKIDCKAFIIIFCIDKIGS